MNGRVIVAKAREYLGTPFHHQGRVKGVGIDCVGLLVCVAQELGLEARDRRDYSRRPDGHSLVDSIAASCDPIAHWQATVGDILVFSLISPQMPQHAALITDRGIIHTYANVRKVVEHGLDETWRKRIHSAWRYRARP